MAGESRQFSSDKSKASALSQRCESAEYFKIVSYSHPRWIIPTIQFQLNRR